MRLIPIPQSSVIYSKSVIMTFLLSFGTNVIAQVNFMSSACSLLTEWVVSYTMMLIQQ